MKINLQRLLILIILVLSNGTCKSQDISSPYFNQQNLSSGDLTFFLQNGFTEWFRSSGVTGYDGEYEIILNNDDFFWASHFLGTNTYTISYDMEIVSFPFLPECYLNNNGCLGTTTRNLFMPSTSIQYVTSTDKWGIISRKKPITKLINTESQSLASIAFADNFSLSTNVNRYYLPHTVIKHTLYLNCENTTQSSTIFPATPPIYSISWIYDNTRGAMKEYPFCDVNGLGCSESQYDVSFIPKLLHFQAANHLYNFNFNSSIMPFGSINYHDYSHITNSNCSIPMLIYPNSTDIFFTPNPLPNTSYYKRAYLPPFALLSSPLMQWRGQAPAGYDKTTNNFPRLPGFLHSYTIDNDIDIVNTEISESDKIFYNPSDVTITAPNLYFPSHYSFRTIRGLYPSPAEVAADDIAINGGPFNDPRDVPVRTDLRCEDATFLHNASIPDHSKYASLYRLAAGSKLTLEPCVSVFDAAFILNPGSTLELANKTTTIGLHRVAIDRNGGRLIEKYELNSGILYLQNKIETALAPNTYYVNSKIFAGENVDVNSLVGPYIASTGTNLELIASDYIKLDFGFHAEAGAEVKIQIDPFMQIPPCPPPASGGSGNRFANLSANSIVDVTAHIKLLPTLFTNSTGIYSENKNEDPIISVEVLDASGKKIKQINEINDNFVEVDLARMNDGMYFFIIQTNKNRKVLKGVKQN